MKRWSYPLGNGCLLQLFSPARRRWGGTKERRFLLLGPLPEGQSHRATMAWGDVSDGVLCLDSSSERPAQSILDACAFIISTNHNHVPRKRATP